MTDTTAHPRLVANTPTTTLGARPSRTARRAGWAATVGVGAFLLFDSVIHLLNIQPVRDASIQLGFDPALSPVIGGIELVFLALYLTRRTSVLGALLLTAYLGGACAAQVRIDAPLFSTLLFPVYTAVLVWGGLWLRDPAVRALVPLRRS